jgi:hypothetical protein
MPALISRIRRCPSSASFSSTMPGDLPVVIGDDPAVAEGVTDHGGHEGQNGFMSRCCLIMAFNGFGADERGVAAQDQDGVGIAAGLFGAEHGMAGAQLFFLDNGEKGVFPQALDDPVPLVADNDNAIRSMSAAWTASST